MARDVCAEITNAIIEKLETCKPWQRPWDAIAANGAPVNAVTHKHYQGGNALHLSIMGRGSNVWATYKQWESIGAQVRKGERSSIIVKWKEFTGRKDETGEAEETHGKRRKFLVPFAACVFNAEQVDGYTIPATATRPEPEVVTNAERVIAESGARVQWGGDKAYYSPSLDYVQMPPRAAFKSTDGLYSTAFHELGHWTGHDKRLARNFQKSTRFGDEHYAVEELVAELTAAFLCGRTGVVSETREDHAAYIKSWLRVLANDKRAIFTAASAAQKAADMLCPVVEVEAEAEREAA